MRTIVLLIFVILFQIPVYGITGSEILQKTDKNLTFSSAKLDAQMITTLGPEVRWEKIRIYLKDDNLGFAQVLSKGIRYFKMNNNLWIYFPSINEVVRISDRMLDQSMQASDFSYRDILEHSKLAENYEADIILESDATYELELTAKDESLLYYKRKILVDKEKFAILKEEIYNKSGKLLKVLTMDEIKKISGRYYPTKLTMKDLARVNTKTELVISDLSFNIYIPPYMFTKSNLERK